MEVPGLHFKGSWSTPSHPKPGLQLGSPRQQGIRTWRGLPARDPESRGLRGTAALKKKRTWWEGGIHESMNPPGCEQGEGVYIAHWQAFFGFIGSRAFIRL